MVSACSTAGGLETSGAGGAGDRWSDDAGPEESVLPLSVGRVYRHSPSSNRMSDFSIQVSGRATLFLSASAMANGVGGPLIAWDSNPVDAATIRTDDATLTRQRVELGQAGTYRFSAYAGGRPLWIGLGCQGEGCSHPCATGCASGYRCLPVSNQCQSVSNGVEVQEPSDGIRDCGNVGVVSADGGECLPLI